MVRRKLLKALADAQAESGLSQSEIARRIGTHRSVISRELRGAQDITLSRVGELAYALGRRPEFELARITPRDGANVPLPQPGHPKLVSDSSGDTRDIPSMSEEPLKSRAAS